MMMIKLDAEMENLDEAYKNVEAPAEGSLELQERQQQKCAEQHQAESEEVETDTPEDD